MKKILILFMAVVMIFSLAACGEDSEQNISPSVSESNTIPAGTSEEPTSDESTEPQSSTDDIRPEFKEAMDSYEAFYDEYCDFMKQYKENPSDLQLLAEYADMVEQLEELDKDFEAWEDADLSDAELKYYLEVTSRVSQKLMDAA